MRVEQATSPVELASHALWRINYIHPFVNGNGRTARAVCYFILCVKLGGQLPGRTTLPEILRREPTRTLYVQALRVADEGNSEPLARLVRQVVSLQIQDRG